jgi:hypothetical protein
MVLAKIDWGTIGKLLWAVPVVGIAVALSFAILIVGWTRADDARRQGAGGAATLYSALALVAGAAFAGVVVYGITLIINKS